MAGNASTHVRAAIRLATWGVAVCLLAGAAGTGNAPEASGGGPAGDTEAARRARLETMPQPERDRLLRNQQRFEQLSPDEQERLRQLHAAIEQDPRADELRQVMRRYQEWIKTLPSSQRAELPTLSTDERIDRIKQWRADERKISGRKLAFDDMPAFWSWLEQRVAQTFSESDRKRYDENKNARERRAMIREQMWDNRGQASWQQFSAEDLEELKKRLSPAGRSVVEETETAGRDQLRRLMYFWIAQSRGGADESRSPDVKQDELARYFDTLSERDRDDLLALPPDEMWQRLARRYLRDNAGGSTPGRRSNPPPSGQRGNRREDHRRDENGRAADGRSGGRSRPDRDEKTQ